MIDLRAKRILVVEDEPIVAMAIEDMLLELGCQVVGPAYSLARAISLIEDESFDAAILDINLNGERSYPAARILAAAMIPFAFATGYAPDRVDADVPAAPVLQKPYNEARIEAILRQILASPTAT